MDLLILHYFHIPERFFLRDNPNNSVIPFIPLDTFKDSADRLNKATTFSDYEFCLPGLGQPEHHPEQVD